MTRANTITLRACAKINLSLQILGKRHDGYHELVTVFQTVDLADKLTVSAGGSGLRIAATGIPVPEHEGNLCLRAACRYFEAAALQPAATIQLEKKIPVGAGLGGGSADAAATVCALHRLVAADVNLGQIAADVGSDVAFFLRGGTALGEGRGERITPCPQPTTGYVLLTNPDLRISTRAAYGLLTAASYSDGARTRELFDRLRQGACLLTCTDLLVNDFEPVIEAHYPQLRRLRERLLSAGAAAAMLSGSGSCVFGLFGDEAVADRCARALGEDGYWHYAGKMVHYAPCEH